jgi:NitT/TauT family transport system substrate-binding protein
MRSSRHLTRFSGAAALGLVALLGLAACGSSGSARTTSAAGSATSSSPVAVTAGNGPFLSNADLYLTKQKGYFSRDGLTVTIAALSAGANAVPQLLNDSMQFAAVDMPTAITAVAHHVPVTIVAPNTVGSPGPTGYAGVITLGSSDVKTAADLVGKTVAVNQLNGTAEIVVKAYLDHAGIDWKQVKFVQVAPPQFLATLQSHHADAAVVGEPLITMAKSMGMRLLFNPEQTTLPDQATFVYIAAKSYVAAHPATVRAFVSALLEGQVQATANPGLVREIAKSSTQIAPTLLAAVTLPAFGGKPVVEADVQKWIGLMVKYGGLSRAEAPKASDVLVPAGS